LLVALGRLMRYFRVITNSGWIDFRRGQAGYLLTLQADAGEAGLPGQPASAVFDAALLTILTMCRAAAGPSFAPSHVQFVRPPPNDARPYEEAFAAPVSFGQLVDGMVLEIAAVESPLPHGNLALARSAEEVLDRYLAQMGGRGLAVRVMAAMAQGLPSGTLSQEGVARALNVSVRTLQRRLREEGASFRGLLERTRRDLALRYVAAGTMSLGEIAFMLGFSDPSNLTRAFRRWTGASPTVWRGRHADDAGAS
jgi:AraC-like DNA-binding protein